MDNSLCVRVIEARGLNAMDADGFSNPYVKLSLGDERFRSKVVEKSLNPTWNEDFCFRVDDLKKELCICVVHDDKVFSDEFLGQMKLPLSRCLKSDGTSALQILWCTLHPKSFKSEEDTCGEIRIGISASQNKPDNSASVSHCHKPTDPSKPDQGMPPALLSSEYSSDDVEMPPLIDCDDQDSNVNLNSPFQELLATFKSQHQGGLIPRNLAEGVLVDQVYAISPTELNSVLFSPKTTFWHSLAEIQGTVGFEAKNWRLENDQKVLKRTVTYTKKAMLLTVRATEEQRYIMVGDEAFAVFCIVSTPDVPLGKKFQTELLYSISSVPELSEGEQKKTRLVISWQMSFLESTIMKKKIESGAREGLTESFDQFLKLLSQKAKVVEVKSIGEKKEQILASMKPDIESDWRTALRFFANFTVLFTVLAACYVLAHIAMANARVTQGLEFSLVDLPDSIGELAFSAVLVLLGLRVLGMVSRFLSARRQKGSDHGVTAQGEGWLLTIALVEGSNLTAFDSKGSDLYVVFTCNGKSKTSSIKFQQDHEPQWNETFEFDAMRDPPSVLKVRVFGGPLEEGAILGDAEINFLKSNLSDLSDVWIPLQGRRALPCQCQLHLRIFLDHTEGTAIGKEYHNEVEMEVGKKINMSSPQKNMEFQRNFSLPQEEILITDFMCNFRCKGRINFGKLFLSPRIIGFQTTLIGRKTKFFFLWQDIEDIHMIKPSLSALGSSTLLITLQKGRGQDAQIGALSCDDEGRLRFQFQIYTKFDVANR
ncbi:hypothetical protein LUZ61_002908 [Rhynchospora tenuis]|uniref:C2 domain-containing protein n=1 Tax=Rhynchospora tenuis TaxID=198213 RepID=A0AAD5ZJY4_9POAL|nr:hypothetical protein LUZ61_002908 [Rhynchospora tenuis]